MPLSQHRTALMGLAMLMVLIYHYSIWVANYLSWLNVGYMGVDIFLLLSAYGLVSSLRQREGDAQVYVSWPKYWHTRAWRIWPLFGITSVIALLVMADAPHGVGEWLTAVVLRMTTLAYYFPNTAIPTDWYLSSLPLFYLLVPLLYGSVRRKPWHVLGVTFTLSSLLLVGYWLYTGNPLHWRYQCAVARVPIFVMGMVLAWHQPSRRLYGCIALGAAILSPMFFEPTRFLSHSLLVPLLLPLAIWLLEALPKRGYNALSLLGHYTLAAYCANLVVEALMPHIVEVELRTATYIIGQVILTLCFIAINSPIQAHLSQTKTFTSNPS
ncbi:MAG: acyltransferase family protein [Bacteroidales bacterium]|nr:acyltransferase family protein [Bacteroidales bacterium]